MALPPWSLGACLMEFIVVHGAKRDREFIAHLQRKPALLHKRQMVRLGRLPAANETRMRGDKFQMVAIAEPTFGCDREYALIDPWTGGDFGRLKWDQGRRHFGRAIVG